MRVAIMSESSVSEDPHAHAPPADTVLEKALCDVVRAFYDSGKSDNLTVKRVRKAAEESLDLEEDFFKSPMWKDRSKRVIEEAFDAHTKAGSEADTPSTTSTPHKPGSIPIARRLKTKPKQRNKRSSPDDTESKKRKLAKKNEELDEELEDELEHDNSSKPPVQDSESASAGTPAVTKTEELSESELSEVDDPEPTSSKVAPAPPDDDREGDRDSDMSVVIDDLPKPKKPRKRKSGVDEAKPKPLKKTKEPKKAKEQEIDPDIVEIKRLQGWLVKCGIRKMWFRELAPYDTQKAKIRRLKEMLADAGMTGRYSIEKANEIREARELQADLQEVQAREKQWGMGGSDGEAVEVEEEEEAQRPKRRLARGLQNLDFLNDDDGEETD